MAPRRKIQPATQAEMLAVLREGIKTQQTKPNIYGYVPHDKQYLFHKSTAHTTLYIGGNRSGKTVGGSVETIYRLIGRHPFKKIPEPPVYGRVHTVDFDYGLDMIILPLISKWVPPSFLIDGSWEKSYDKEHKVLRLNNGSFLEARSYQQDMEKFAGTSRHFNWFDEEPPKHIFNESQARLVDTNGDAYLTMTPVDGMTWVHDDLYIPGISGDDPETYVIEISMEENPHLSAEARERFLKTLDPEERKAREKGTFVAMGGRIFKEFSRGSHVIPFDLPPANWQHYCTFDHGYNNPTAILWHAVSPEGRVVTYSEHYASEMTVDEHAQVFHARNVSFGRVPDFVVGDPAMAQRSGITGTSILQEYADRGVYIGAERTDVDSGLNRMVRYLKVDPETGLPNWQITENCVNLIREMGVYRWATYSSRKMQFEKNAQEKPHKKDDHAIDSTRYMFTFLPDLRPTALESPVGRTPAKIGRDSGMPLGVRTDWSAFGRKSTGTQWTTTSREFVDPMEYS